MEKRKKVYEFHYQDDVTQEVHTQLIQAIGIEHAEEVMMDWLIEPDHGKYTYLSGPFLGDDEGQEKEATEATEREAPHV